MDSTAKLTRREALRRSLGRAAGAILVPSAARSLPAATHRPGEKMRFGLVTYLWGQDWQLPNLIANCASSGVLGVELRTTHAHGVEPTLSAAQRADVKKRFADSPVELVGIGSNERYDNPDPARVAAAIEATKEFVRLSHDVGGSGVKVKPDRFHDGVPREQTIAQIASSLYELGEYANEWGQEIRLEVHGQCAELPTIRRIIDLAPHPRVAVCWNSNAQDLGGAGLWSNFHLVARRFGRTAHVRELNDERYPYAQLFELLTLVDYDGWVLLEARGKPADRVAALRAQRRLFSELIARAQQKRWA